MTIQELIQEIITGANWTETVSFYGGVKSEHNLLHDERKFPAVLLIEPVVSKDGINMAGVILPKYPLMLLFAMQSQMDWDQATQDSNCIIPMRQLARKFTLSALANKKIKDVANVSRTNFTNIFDVNMSGCIWAGDITPENDETLCL